MPSSKEMQFDSIAVYVATMSYHNVAMSYCIVAVDLEGRRTTYNMALTGFRSNGYVTYTLHSPIARCNTMSYVHERRTK